MQKSFALYLFVLFALLWMPLRASTAKQSISVCYFDDEKVQTRIPKSPNFLRGSGDTAVNQGYMLFYERKAFDLWSIGSIYAGGDVARWTQKGEQIYSGTLFLSSRIWVLHMLLLHPFIEYSLFGPTLLSKTNFGGVDFGSRFLFQNYLSLGAELGSGTGITIDVKALRYFRADLSRPKEGFQVPLLLSLGVLF